MCMQVNDNLDRKIRSYPVLKKPPLLFFVAVSCLFLVHCTERARNNPLDPLNPVTGGKPSPPSLLSFQDTIRVSWAPLALTNLTGYNIYRRLQNQSHYQKIARVPPRQNEYIETEAEYDLTRYYRLSASTADFESLLSDSAVIRPGPSFLWAIDADLGELVRLTHDARYEVVRTGALLQPSALAVNPKDHTAWVADPFLGEINQYAADGRRLQQFRFGRSVSAMVLDTTDSSFWMLKADSGRVYHYSASGQLLKLVEDLDQPTGLVLHAGRQSVWIVERRSGAVHEITRFAHRRITFDVRNALALAVNSRADVLWIADSSAVVRIDLSTGAAARIGGFRYAARLAVDETSGACWVADWLERFGISTVVKLSSNGRIEANLSGFAEPKSLAVNPFNGHCFVAEPDVREFYELDAQGAVLLRRDTAGGFSLLAVELLRP